nr:transglycosylase domain-containing protein [Chloroflexota bacterium]
MRRLFLAALFILFIVSLFIVHASRLFTDLPSLDRLTENLTVPSTKILARDGRLLYEVTDPAGAHHTTLPLADIPRACRQATIAVEDASFYTNPGVDVVGIARAVWINLRGGEVLSGGSTITQQVARNMLLDPQERAERTLLRKLRESILAWRLARAYSKDDILALYLNQTYYGHLAYGIEAAARTYFGRGARDLDLAQCALLAGLPQAPALFDPLTDPQAAGDKQAIVLDLMVKNHMLTDDEARLAKSEPLQFAASPFPIDAPHFVFYVWSLLEARFAQTPEVLRSGLTVTTTLDLDLVHTAEDIVARRLKELADPTRAAPRNATDAALVALDPNTGQLLAMVGSPDYFNGEISGAVNMAVAPRQPGSAIKPVTYAAAFDPSLCAALPSPSGTPKGRVGGEGEISAQNCPWTPATMILDVRTAFVTHDGFSYVPQNYDRNYHGPVPARDALGGSLNVPAVKTLDHVGLKNMLALAGKVGLGTLADADRFGLALTLGGGEVRLLDLTSAFGVFAAGGVRVAPVAILKITDARGNVLDEWKPKTGERVLDARVAYLINNLLSDNSARLATFGPNSVLQIGRPAAVKTGTTTDFRDNWTVGYAPQLSVGVWVGNADNSPMANITGVAGAGPIWHDFIRQALNGKPAADFPRPPGLTQVEVCALSGLLPTPYCPLRRMEIFIEGTQPTTPDTFYQPFDIDTASGALATEATPPERRRTETFLVLPPEAQDWARSKGLPLPPTAGSPDSTSGLRLTGPDDATVYSISPRLPLANQQIIFSASSGRPLQSVSFVLDGEIVATLGAPPYQSYWALTPGRHTLIATGVTGAGATVQSAPVTFTVNP